MEEPKKRGEMTDKIEQSHCNKCSHKTKHAILVTRKQHGSEPYDRDYDLTWCTTWTVLECCGCGNVTLRRSYWFSEWDHGDIEVEHYPPPVSRRTPEWVNGLPHEFSSLLHEIYTALHADSRRLALMGASTILDMFMLDKIGDVGGFREKLNKLEPVYISKRNKDILQAALDAGSAAAHRGYDPSVKEINLVIDIVENLLQTDILEYAAAKLKRDTPPRKRKDESK